MSEITTRVSDLPGGTHVVAGVIAYQSTTNTVEQGEHRSTMITIGGGRSTIVYPDLVGTPGQRILLAIIKDNT